MAGFVFVVPVAALSRLKPLLQGAAIPAGAGLPAKRPAQATNPLEPMSNP